FARAYLLAARFDDVVFPRHEVEISLLVRLEEVSGVKHSLAGQVSGSKRPVGLRRHLPVSFHHVRAAHDQFADDPGTDAVAGLIDDIMFLVGHAATYRARAARSEEH